MVLKKLVSYLSRLKYTAIFCLVKTKTKPGKTKFIWRPLYAMRYSQAMAYTSVPSGSSVALL